MSLQVAVAAVWVVVGEKPHYLPSDVGKSASEAWATEAKRRTDDRAVTAKMPLRKEAPSMLLGSHSSVLGSSA
ncbi:hypothetical protein CPLU01_07472 [Colletotrichum plurivorum]|uniref:Uncharacterized protein n=1 Tax=Colletotrichum plurivorum TaxID=2175906 RepID=A0A8H6NER7_9PEZI|nr:hypothetical protein CPLU01_07472 [Colletotrichum plurivorum]